MTCLFLLTGKYPWDFPWDSVTTAVDWHQAVVISADFAALMKRMTALSPQDRYPSAAAILADLTDLPPIQHPVVEALPPPRDAQGARSQNRSGEASTRGRLSFPRRAAGRQYSRSQSSNATEAKTGMALNHDAVTSITRSGYPTRGMLIRGASERMITEQHPKSCV